MNEPKNHFRDTLLPLLQFGILGLLVALINYHNTQTLLTAAVIGLVVVAAALFFFARRSGRKDEGQTQAEQAMDRLYMQRKLLLWSCAGLATAGILMAGLLSREYLPRSFTAQVLLLVFFCLPFVLVGLNQLLLQLETRKWNDATAQEMHDFLASHRETDRSPELFRQMLTFRRLAGVFTVCLAVSATGLAFTSGLVCRKPIFLVPPFLLSDLCLICAFSRIRLRIPKKIIQEGCVSRYDYPLLYEMAGKAQKALGCSGDIQIDITSECNAGLAISDDGTNYLALGATLLSVVTEEELYAVLLHEFGHAAASTEAVRSQSSYSLWLNSAATGRVMDFILFTIFGYFDLKYTVKYQLYEYAVSLNQEFKADQAMIRHGDAQAAGSVLLKLSYFDYYHWENSDGPNLFAEETMSHTSLRDSIAQFRQAIEERGPFWNKMVAGEIQSQSASHPTLRARLNAMGIQAIALSEGHRSDAYLKEVDRAVRYVDDYIYTAMSREFEAQRKDFYLEPLSDVQKWEEAGKPLDPGGYTDIVLALRVLRRYEEAEELCNRAIKELPDYSSHDACYVKGVLMLHRYDPRGIDYLYKAIGANHNHVESGMEEIGNFCCLTGRQKDLDAYRKKALELCQEDMDTYSHIDTLSKSDDLRPESLPPELLEGLLQVIREQDHGLLDRVYLVRKQITGEFFTSVVILKFRPDADPERSAELDHRIFRFLDTATDWQFSLMDYDKNVHVERIHGSCIYEGKTEN